MDILKLLLNIISLFQFLCLSYVYTIEFPSVCLCDCETFDQSYSISQQNVGIPQKNLSCLFSIHYPYFVLLSICLYTQIFPLYLMLFTTTTTNVFEVPLWSLKIASS